jgi:hypothetical protein
LGLLFSGCTQLFEQADIDRRPPPALKLRIAQHLTEKYGEKQLADYSAAAVCYEQLREIVESEWITTEITLSCKLEVLDKVCLRAGTRNTS